MRCFDILQRNKKQVIQVETAALLHDLDKLCSEFVNDHKFHSIRTDVRKQKQKRWEQFIGKNETINIKDVDLSSIDIADNQVTITNKYFGKISCPFVEHHENRESVFSTLAMLVHGGGSGADGIDSELDKNATNKGEQNGACFYIDTPFGYQSRQWSDELENVLDIIQKTDFSNIDRTRLLEDLKPHFSAALGETRYPCNDVTLWAHSYSVATLTKALLAKFLIEYDNGTFTAQDPYLLPVRKKDLNPENNPTDFTLLKVTFDREWILGTAQKAGDIVGMVDQIATLQDLVCRFYENELLIGNETYRDEQRQVFILPRLGTWQKKNMPVFPELQHRFEEAIFEKLDNKITALLQEHQCQGFPYAIEFADSAALSPPLESDRILVRTRDLLSSEAVCTQSVSAMLNLADIHSSKERCEVCGLQTVADNRERICHACYRRRHNRKLTAKRSIYHEHTTANLESLIDRTSENKLLLFSISFDLTDLWNGKLFENVSIGTSKPKHKNTSPGRLLRSHETLQSFFETFRNELTTYYPKGIFPVTLSPMRLEFVVSTHRLADVISLLYRQYEEQFGKIRTHLPLSIGIIVFYHKFPLYIVLEAANRLRHHVRPQKRTLTIIHNTERDCHADLLSNLDCQGLPMAFNWTVPTCRSDGNKDDFYPFLDTGAAAATHVRSVIPDHDIQISEGGFDFLLLDSAARRFAISPRGLYHHIFGNRPAWPLSIWQHFHRLGHLLDKLEKSQISRIENLLTEKRMQWKQAWQTSDKVIKQFCTAVVMAPNSFGKKNKDGRYLLLDDKSNDTPLPPDSDKALLINAAANGLLLDAIDFFLHIPGLKRQARSDTVTYETP
jgi:hypothetical protein